MLISNQRSILERLHTKLITCRCQCFRIKWRRVFTEQRRYDVYNCGLARSRVTIECNELLNLFAVALNDRADSPLQLLAFGWGIQRIHQLVVCWRLFDFKRIIQLKCRVISTLWLFVRKDYRLIQITIIIWGRFNIVDELLIDACRILTQSFDYDYSIFRELVLLPKFEERIIYNGYNV